MSISPRILSVTSSASSKLSTWKPRPVELSEKRKSTSRDPVLTATVITSMPPALAASAAADAFVKHSLSVVEGPCLQSLGRLLPSSKVVGVPSVNNRMYRNEPKAAELSVCSHCAIACCVFVQPPLYSMAFVRAIVEARSSSRGAATVTTVLNARELTASASSAEAKAAASGPAKAQRSAAATEPLKARRSAAASEPAKA